MSCHLSQAARTTMYWPFIIDSNESSEGKIKTTEFHSSRENEISKCLAAIKRQNMVCDNRMWVKNITVYFSYRKCYRKSTWTIFFYRNSEWNQHQTAPSDIALYTIYKYPIQKIKMECALCVSRIYLRLSIAHWYSFMDLRPAILFIDIFDVCFVYAYVVDSLGLYCLGRMSHVDWLSVLFSWN